MSDTYVMANTTQNVIWALAGTWNIWRIRLAGGGTGATRELRLISALSGGSPTATPLTPMDTATTTPLTGSELTTYQTFSSATYSGTLLTYYDQNSGIADAYYSSLLVPLGVIWDSGCNSSVAAPLKLDATSSIRRGVTNVNNTGVYREWFVSKAS